VTLRWKIALALAGLTFVASAVVGIAVYRVTKDRLLTEIDRSLANVNPRPGRGPFELEQFGDRGPLRGFEAQIVGADGSVAESTFEIPVTNTDLAGAAASDRRKGRRASHDGRAVERTTQPSAMKQPGSIRLLSSAVSGWPGQLAQPTSQNKNTCSCALAAMTFTSTSSAAISGVITTWFSSRLRLTMLIVAQVSGDRMPLMGVR